MPKEKASSDEEKAGLEAIVFLLGIGGIVDTEEHNLGFWRAMSKAEKDETISLYKIFQRLNEMNAEIAAAGELRG